MVPEVVSLLAARKGVSLSADRLHDPEVEMSACVRLQCRLQVIPLSFPLPSAWWREEVSSRR